MLLSIVMMIKNEEKYLDKTLSALKPLMKDIDSELIILDTGSTDNSIEICKKYTNKIYFSQWNNNFGDMRNISISYASGEWALILDADEELIKYDKLKEFFDSDLYREYNCASIELKNIYNKDESSYNLSSIYRLFRNTEEFRYEGTIHEQPIYKGPVYNDIATFKHYGYMFINEEIRQFKNKRNFDLLLKEIKDKPNNPYTNYQLGKSYMINNKNEDAAFYIEKSYELYKKLGYAIPAFVYCDLANLYINKKDFVKCERLCANYIKKDSKNIDIHYYMGQSLKQLGKYKESLKSYEKYMYYVENYSLSTQSKDIRCMSNTISFTEKCKIEIIELYYKLEKYEEILYKIDSLSKEQIKSVYYIVFIALYKLNKPNKIIELYNDILNNEIDKKDFIIHLEISLQILKEEEKVCLHRLLSKIDDNYGLLNKLRIGEKIHLEAYKDILKNETGFYYSDVLYYGFKNGVQIEYMLNDLNYVRIQELINNLVSTRRDSIIDLFNYLYNVPNTLDKKKIHIYSALSKVLFVSGNLFDEKYELLFLMYIKYRYDCIKSNYNTDLSDKEILEFVKDKEDYFIMSINIIQGIKKTNKLDYIVKMKELLRDNHQYQKAIEVLVDKFESEYKEINEMKELRNKYKSIIENSINAGKIKDATIMIEEYEAMFENDIEIYNMKGIINIFNNNLGKAEYLFKKALLLDNNNSNTLFNIAYLKEVLDDNEEALRFYKRICRISKEEEVVLDAKEKIKYIEENFTKGV